jgi:predicted DNA binding protein
MAKHMGYYEVPRKTTSRKIAKVMHLSKATTLEHLRKAEKRIINHILVGY